MCSQPRGQPRNVRRDDILDLRIYRDRPAIDIDRLRDLAVHFERAGDAVEKIDVRAGNGLGFLQLLRSFRPLAGAPEHLRPSDQIVRIGLERRSVFNEHGLREIWPLLLNVDAGELQRPRGGRGRELDGVLEG